MVPGRTPGRMTYELGIVGAGNMAEAIARGVIGKGLLQSNQIIAADITPQRRELFEKELNIRAVTNNYEAARDARVILLSVKPQQMAEALAGLGTVMTAGQLLVSIAAGVT